MDHREASDIQAAGIPRAKEIRMLPGRSSWLTRSIGLALSRLLLRHSLALHGARGAAILATVVSDPGSGDEQRQAPAPPVQDWAARLSHPSVEVLVLGDHIVVQGSGELIASGSLQDTEQRQAPR
jgi:hypothetical protein